jgi:hypothetical protein
MRVIIAFAVLAVSSLGGCSRPYQEFYAKPIPSSPLHVTKVKWVKRPHQPARNLPELTKTRLVKPPLLPPGKSAQTRSPIPPTGSPAPPVLTSAPAKHYVVRDTVGNCAVIILSAHLNLSPGNIWARPGDDLEIIGDKGGYASLDAANKALVKCKDLVGTGAEAKFKAAQAKAEKLGGVDKLTSEDIEGLSQEQLKQLRGY